MRQQFAEPYPCLSVLGKLESGACEREFCLAGRHTRQTLTETDGRGQVLPLHLLQQRFIIEEVQLGRRSVLKQIDDAFGSRGEIGKTELRQFFITFSEKIGDEQRAQRDGADAKAGAVQEPASVHRKSMFEKVFFHAIDFNFRTGLAPVNFGTDSVRSIPELSVSVSDLVIVSSRL